MPKTIRPSSPSNSSEPTDGKPSRHIPAAIRRTVARRDAGRCTYRSPEGRRCRAREFLEFHHLDPWTRARTHSIEGITLRCRAHNQYQACRDFGERRMARFRTHDRIEPRTPPAESTRNDLPREPQLDLNPVAPKVQAVSSVRRTTRER